LNQKGKLTAVARFAQWQIRSRLVRRPVVHQWIDGAKFFVQAGETGLTQNIYCGLHDFSEMALLLHVLRRDDLFVEVGANAGSYTILACVVRGALAYALEPLPRTYSRLSENIKLNHLEGRVKRLCPKKRGVPRNSVRLFTASLLTSCRQHRSQPIPASHGVGRIILGTVSDYVQYSPLFVFRRIRNRLKSQDLQGHKKAHKNVSGTTLFGC
jgi:hypothetical protein